MDSINIQATEDTPQVVLDPEQNKFEVSGRSFPEDAAEFYDPVVNWLEEYFGSNSRQSDLTFNFKLEYLNTASFRQIYKLLLLLSEYNDDNCNIQVKWQFKSGDKSMREAGERFLRLIDLPVELIER